MRRQGEGGEVHARAIQRAAGSSGVRRGEVPRQPLCNHSDSPAFVNGLEGGAVTPPRWRGEARRWSARRPDWSWAAPRTGERENALGATAGRLPERAPEGLSGRASQPASQASTRDVEHCGWQGEALPPWTPGLRAPGRSRLTAPTVMPVDRLSARSNGRAWCKATRATDRCLWANSWQWQLAGPTLPDGLLWAALPPASMIPSKVFVR